MKSIQLIIAFVILSVNYAKAQNTRITSYYDVNDKKVITSHGT